MIVSTKRQVQFAKGTMDKLRRKRASHPELGIQQAEVYLDNAGKVYFVTGEGNKRKKERKKCG